MSLNSSPLLLTEEAWRLPTEFYSCWNARGLYDPLQFTLRLRPDIRRALDSAPVGLVGKDQFSEEQLQAFSTFLHENIHWWQHVGSTTGLILSLIYPAQSHLNHRYLKEILIELGPVKSLRDYDLQHSRQEERETNLSQKINIALNNWHDIEFYRWLVIDPNNIRPKIDDPYFESVGHSYQIAIGAVLWLLSSTIDPDMELFPDPRNWESRATKLRQERVDGFYYGSPIVLSPIGAKEIFEGQARFNQLQYLYLSSGRTVSWDDFQRAGMFEGVYIAAFKCFLKVAEVGQPTELDDSVVGLFLLVCDVAVNPAECFVEDLDSFDRLIEVHDPGIRFLRLCIAIRQNKNLFSSCINNYSANEYWKTTQQLCSITGFTSPRTLIGKVISWPKKHQRIAALLEEDKTFDFGLSNLPVRVFLARFIQFQIDKFTAPEFFCWPGVWMTTAKSDGIAPQAAFALFNEHSALFVDKEDGDVYPTVLMGRDEKTVSETFNRFYAWVATYDLTRQWLVEAGGFDYDFSWLSSKFAKSEMEAWVCNNFEEAFGVSPKDFKIVP